MPRVGFWPAGSASHASIVVPSSTLISMCFEVMLDIVRKDYHSELLMMTARFDSPKAIVTGGGCRRQAPELLASLHAHRALMVADPFFANAEFVNEIRSNLQGKGIATDLFTDFQPDPTDQNVMAGAGRFRACGSDSIIAVGGGSALDVAKMIGIAVTNAGSLSQFQGYHRIPNPGPALVAVPTTAGTGSEATKVAVITDTTRQVKMMILDA